MLMSIVVLAIAALVHAVRYILLIINRSTLLNPVVAAAALWLGCWPAWRRSSLCSPARWCWSSG